MEEVFDYSTLMTVYKLLNRGLIDNIYGAFKSGKESKLYLGIDSQDRMIAIKIYLTASAEFKKGMLVYIHGDPRFKHVKKTTRSLVYTWAQKEFKNLKRAFESGVRVPEPYHVEKNILIMEMISTDGIPAPLLKDKELSNPNNVYDVLLKYVKILYKKARLVHGDLSEYNVMICEDEPVIFDVSQAVTLEHPKVEIFLRRDLYNLNNYFKKLGVEVKKVEEICEWIIEDA